MVRSKTWGTLSLALTLTALTACGDRTAPSSSTSADIDSSNSPVIGESSGASALATLKLQHQYLNNGHRRLAATGAGSTAASPLGTPRPVLPAGVARHFKHDSSGIVPVLLQHLALADSGSSYCPRHLRDRPGRRPDTTSSECRGHSLERPVAYVRR